MAEQQHPFVFNRSTAKKGIACGIVCALWLWLWLRHQQIIIIIFKYKAALIYTIACFINALSHTLTRTHDADGSKHRFWFCAIIRILSSYFTLFSSLLLLLSFLASNCLTIVLRRLAIRSVHAARKFSISFFPLSLNCRTKNGQEDEEKIETKSETHITVYYRFVNAGHTHRNCILTDSYQLKEVLAVTFFCVWSLVQFVLWCPASHDSWWCRYHAVKLWWKITIYLRSSCRIPNAAQ